MWDATYAEKSAVHVTVLLSRMPKYLEDSNEETSLDSILVAN